MIGQLAEKYPATWGLIPKGLFLFGSGGVNSSGAICGNVNGGIAVLTQMGAPTNVKDHFLRWFENTPIPTNAAYVDYRSGAWVPAVGWGGTGMPIPLNNAPKVKTGTLTCHGAHTKWKVVASSWLAAKGSAANSDRCGKTTYDSAYKLATLINEWQAGATIDGSLDPQVGSTAAGCKQAGCHAAENPPTGVGGKMRCTPCHTQRLGDGHNL